MMPELAVKRTRRPERGLLNLSKAMTCTGVSSVLLALSLDRSTKMRRLPTAGLETTLPVGSSLKKVILALSTAPRAEADTDWVANDELVTVAVAVPEGLVRRDDCKAPFKVICTLGRACPAASRMWMDTG